MISNRYYYFVHSKSGFFCKILTTKEVEDGADT